MATKQISFNATMGTTNELIQKDLMAVQRLFESNAANTLQTAKKAKQEILRKAGATSNKWN